MPEPESTMSTTHQIWIQGATDRVAHSPYITQLEAHVNELLCLLHTAIERMGQTALHRRLAQALQ
jgi:hypothetical protein